MNEVLLYVYIYYMAQCQFKRLKVRYNCICLVINHKDVKFLIKKHNYISEAKHRITQL